MASTTPVAQPVAAPQPIPVRELLPWVVFGLAVALIALFFVSTEQGAVSVFSGTGIHEWVHDGRHLLGFPCH